MAKAKKKAPKVGDIMSNDTVGVLIAINKEAIRGLLCSAFEGGMSRNWARIEDIHMTVTATNALTSKWTKSQQAPLMPGCHVEIRDFEDGDKLYKLDFAAIERGLKIMAEQYGYHFGDFMGDKEDGITGDVFLQCCIFGEVKYG